MSLVFEVAAPARAASPQRADVAFCAGFVSRRPGVPLPASVWRQLQAGGWTAGPWARSVASCDSLLNLPVIVDSWQLFDTLFAWDERPLMADSGVRCATYLGAAVRSFFARGGRRAVVLRVGDPWPYLESGASRARQRRQRLRLLLPQYARREAAARPFAPHEPAQWQGLEHLYGLPEPSLVLLPDLADACTYEPAPPPTAIEAEPAPEVFVECSAGEVEPPADTGLRRVPAPRLDGTGYAAWRLAIEAARDFLADPRHRREALLVAALPLPDASARRVSGGGGHVHAQADLLAFLRRAGVLPAEPPTPDESGGTGARSAFVQLAWPWLRTQAAADLPEALEPADGVLAGLVAAGAVSQGCFRSVAGEFSRTRLRDIGDAEPVPAWGAGPDSPAGQLARHVCVFAPAPGGWALQSDVTPCASPAWRSGGASRLLSTLLRNARAAGDALCFDSNGPATWARLRSAIEDLLLAFWSAGAFGGDTPSEAFDVRCDRSTMTQADLDNGRLVVHIEVRPAHAVERIRVVLQLGNTALSGAVQEAL